MILATKETVSTPIVIDVELEESIVLVRVREENIAFFKARNGKICLELLDMTSNPIEPLLDLDSDGFIVANR